jgi:diacylglycerol kinase family enzyme
MGLDAEIGGMQNKFKAIPLLSAAGAYYPAIIYGILRKIKNVFSIRIDDGEEYTQPCLFCVVANSRWYGGGYFSAPMASPTDGFLDFIIVKKTLNRFQLLPLISKYKAGQHLEWDFTRHERGKKLSIRSEKPAAVNLDGEVFYAKEAVFEVIPECMNFVIPAK